MQFSVIVALFGIIFGLIGWGLYFWERRQRRVAQIAVTRWQKIFTEWKRAAEVWQESAQVWREASKIWRETAEKYQTSSETWRELYLQQEESKEDEELIN
ncbi:MAG: hypothetical protein AB1489_21120 [Acidobacteriota bacterium]